MMENVHPRAHSLIYLENPIEMDHIANTEPRKKNGSISAAMKLSMLSNGQIQNKPTTCMSSVQVHCTQTRQHSGMHIAQWMMCRLCVRCTVTVFVHSIILLIEKLSSSKTAQKARVVVPTVLDGDGPCGLCIGNQIWMESQRLEKTIIEHPIHRLSAFESSLIDSICFFISPAHNLVLSPKLNVILVNS